MMEDVGNNPLQESQDTSPEIVDLNSETASLTVDISDALSEKDTVKFTVHTKTTLPEFSSPEISVVRHHDEFVWLHDALEANEDYAGIVIPPVPPRPDFDASREKLQTLGDLDKRIPHDEFQKMKQELEAEYLATFKKTVAMHEVFLQRLASHSYLRSDVNFKVFLEYQSELNVRGKNNREKISGFLKSVSQSADEMLLSNQKDTDEYFEGQRAFLVEYFNRIKDCANKADKMTRSHKNVADSYIKISTNLVQLAAIDNQDLEKLLNKIAETLEKARKIEGRVSSDEDLKLTDTLKYYMRDTMAAKNLLFRRLKMISNLDIATKTLEKTRAKNKPTDAAEEAERNLSEKVEKMSVTAKQELADFKSRRIALFKKNLIDLAELELKHSRAQVNLLTSAVNSMKEIEPVN
ncbi:hypothetical protein HELRODRAFT_185264 [Helobdella robusta]|uniref:Sorting nexin n=1 Tax=Helobdella robusta TaxID=6412 RepID=T1FMK9_HELRO|nr:hypothetical protein HELRODRAFT_185264 [Helobdella robusta]ESO10688.1 hypothetical protein HELRODRAFT_185264 [Helobdella robusta]